jgi:hypothetical protein
LFPRDGRRTLRNMVLMTLTRGRLFVPGLESSVRSAQLIRRWGLTREGRGRGNSRARTAESFFRRTTRVSEQPFFYVIYYILSSGSFAVPSFRASPTSSSSAGEVLKFLVHTSRNCCKPQWNVVLLTVQHTTCQSSCHIVSQNYLHSVYNCEFSTYLRVGHMWNFLNLWSSTVQIYNLARWDSDKFKSKYLYIPTTISSSCEIVILQIGRVLISGDKFTSWHCACCMPNANIASCALFGSFHALAGLLSDVMGVGDFFWAPTASGDDDGVRFCAPLPPSPPRFRGCPENTSRNSRKPIFFL